MKITIQHNTLSITDFNEFDACRIGLAVEKQGIRFYEKILECVQNEEVKPMIKFLIEEERKHLTFFENALTELRREKEEPCEDEDLFSSMNFGIFEPYQEMKEMCTVIDDIERALDLGIIIEERSIAFYRACRDQVSSVRTKEELDRIIDEEKRHKELFLKVIKIEKGV
ncbi:MAG: ferritin family protein [Candidatus Omnitrophica bacterium]|nr:ferritin family protein [Candidatus Omnitrophota bacterium]